MENKNPRLLGAEQGGKPMPTILRVQYNLPDAQFLNEMLTDDLILRYVKDDYSRSEHDLEFYDTENWSLMSRGFSLGVTRSLAVPVIELQQGLRPQRDFPGYYEGRQFIAPYEKEGDLIEPLMRRGAPNSFRETASSAPLERWFSTSSHRLSTTLYLPDRTRVDMAFDHAELAVEDKRQPSYFLFFELLFGEPDLLLNYCEQVAEHFRLKPVQLSRQQMALRILRSR